MFPPEFDWVVIVDRNRSRNRRLNADDALPDRAHAVDDITELQDGGQAHIVMFFMAFIVPVEGSGLPGGNRQSSRGYRRVTAKNRWAIGWKAAIRPAASELSAPQVRSRSCLAMSTHLN
jgi:hypothetical protein